MWPWIIGFLPLQPHLVPLFLPLCFYAPAPLGFSGPPSSFGPSYLSTVISSLILTIKSSLPIASYLPISFSLKVQLNKEVWHPIAILFHNTFAKIQLISQWVFLADEQSENRTMSVLFKTVSSKHSVAGIYYWWLKRCYSRFSDKSIMVEEKEYQITRTLACLC